MFQLLQPIWLFSLAGLSIPVIIHLWNRKPGKTLKVGSIALVKESVLSYKRRIKLSALLLLLLRCLLLACIAIALAVPLWRSPEVAGSKGWVLMNRQQLPATYSRFRPIIDSLLQAGLEFHYFEDGFKKDKLENALKAQTNTAGVKQLFYRGIAALLNEQADSKLPLYIFTDNYLRNFSGNRNTVSLNLHWFTYTADTVQVKSFIDTTALQVTIFNRNYSNDAHYLQAATDAIRQFSKKNINVRLVTDTANVPPQQDWLFWLDDTAPADIKAAKNVLLYAKDEPVKRASYILPAREGSFAGIDLYKSIIEKDSAKKLFDTRWQDGFGQSLLSEQQRNNTVYYYLYTHFDPSWNELPWSDNFPAILYQLLYAGRPHEVLGGITDKTIIDPLQSTPVVLPAHEAAIKPAIFAETTLSGIFWVLSFLLFFAERSLSFYHRKKIDNG